MESELQIVCKTKPQIHHLSNHGKTIRGIDSSQPKAIEEAKLLVSLWLSETIRPFESIILMTDHLKKTRYVESFNPFFRGRTTPLLLDWHRLFYEISYPRQSNMTIIICGTDFFRADDLLVTLDQSLSQLYPHRRKRFFRLMTEMLDQLSQPDPSGLIIEEKPGKFRSLDLFHQTQKLAIKNIQNWEGNKEKSHSHLAPLSGWGLGKISLLTHPNSVSTTIKMTSITLSHSDLTELDLDLGKKLATTLGRWILDISPEDKAWSLYTSIPYSNLLINLTFWLESEFGGFIRPVSLNEDLFLGWFPCLTLLNVMAKKEPSALLHMDSIEEMTAVACWPVDNQEDHEK